MATKVFINDSTLTQIGDAIRICNGETAKYFPGDMPNKIKALKKQSQTKTVTPTKSTQTVTPTSGRELTEVVVNPIPDEYIIPSGSLSISANGSYDVKSKASVDVNVPTPVSQGWTELPIKSTAVTGSSYCSGVTTSGNTANATISCTATTAATAFTVTYNMSSLTSGTKYEFMLIIERSAVSSGYHAGGYYSLPFFVGGATGNYAGSRFGGNSSKFTSSAGARNYISYATSYGVYPYRLVPSTGVLTFYVRYNSNSTYGCGTLNGTYGVKAYYRELEV